MSDRLSLLVADDEAMIRSRVRMMLGRHWRIDEAATAEAARSASVEDYDAVLLDIVFPDGDGIDVCREIKERHPHSTVVVSSSLESVEAWDKAFQAGADGYLEKRELLGLDHRKILLMIRNLVERNRLRSQAEETTRRQGELLAVLSHDVRAPFQALVGTIQQLKKSRIPPDAARDVETLHRCAADQLAFINSLLELLRLESGAATLRVHSVDVNLVVGQCVQSLGILAEDKEISLSTELDRSLPRVKGDMARIAQLINNLVSNAIKFTPRCGSIKVKTGATIRQDRPGVEIRVEDSGIGIAEKDREKIFQRFGRGCDRGTAGERGTGLGLSICRQIVDLHRGTLELDGDRVKGTSFIAWIPTEQMICSPSCGEQTCKPQPAPPGEETRTGTDRPLSTGAWGPTRRKQAGPRNDPGKEQSVLPPCSDRG